MPRKYIRRVGSKKYHDFEEEDMRNAINAVNAGISTKGSIYKRAERSGERRS